MMILSYGCLAEIVAKGSPHGHSAKHARTLEVVGLRMRNLCSFNHRCYSLTDTDTHRCEAIV